MEKEFRTTKINEYEIHTFYLISTQLSISLILKELESVVDTEP